MLVWHLMSKPLSYEDMAGLNRLLISHGLTVTQKASTVSMVLEKGATTPKIVRVQGWLSLREVTTETQGIIDEYVGGLA